MGSLLNIDEVRFKTVRSGSIEALALAMEKFSTPVAIRFFLKAVGTSADEIGIDPFDYTDYSQLEGILLYIMDFGR